MQIPTLKDPHIMVRKNARVLELFDGDKLVKTYKIALGFSPVGDKEVEGDGRTPEGEFYAFVKNAKSKYVAGLGVSYPNIEDATRGLAAGLITQDEAETVRNAIEAKKKPPQKTALGGEVYIHGGGTERDWTHGCIALDDTEMKELFDSVPVGVRITILP
jgi:murein L,D-transpeptidase YafK